MPKSRNHDKSRIFGVTIFTNLLFSHPAKDSTTMDYGLNLFLKDNKLVRVVVDNFVPEKKRKKER